MERLIKQVTESLEKAGLVEVEVSARHVHLTAEDVEALFGKGASGCFFRWHTGVMSC